MPPICRVGATFPADPFGVQLTDSIKDDLVDLFTGDECEDIFRNVDFSAIDIEDVDVSVFSSYDSEDDIEAEFLDAKRYMEVKNHDCMWGGQCCNKEFFRTQPPPPPVVRAPPPVRPASQQPVLITHSSQNKVVTIQKCIQKCSGSDRTESQQVVVVTNTNKVPVRSEGRSLLLNRTTHTQQPAPPVKVPTTPSPVKIKREFLTPQNSRPETPQSLSGSDEEDYVPIPLDSHNTTTIRSVLDAFTSSSSSSSSCDWEEEFSVLGRSKDDKSAVVRNMTVATNDHSYVQGVPAKSVKLENLGVDTPSDSEEEIDVVSLSERSSSSRSSSCGGLPTRPTLRDQEHLEEITTSLLSASEAVSRKLKKTITHKRKKYESESSEDDDDTEGPDQDQEDDDDRDEEMEERIARYSMTKLAHRQTKRQKQSPSKVRRKKVPRFTGEEDDLMRRDMHNNMERMRRIDLRNAFEELKAIVPAVASKDRAAKVVILREAAQYCDELGAESRSKYMQVMALRKEQQRLHNIVRSLRRAAAQAVKTPRPYY